MDIRNHRKQTFKHRISILISTSVIFIISFVLNITQDTALYNYNLYIVPILQNNSIMSTHGFMVFMNVVSMVFDPMICAGYIFVIYLISFRKLEILAFLLWFFMLTWLLGILKMAIHQPRPFWLPTSQVQSHSWACYTDYGNPSGHSMLAIVLLEFLLRFYARVHHCISRFIGLFYILIFGIQLLVMFSRIMLGMHSLNQVLFGLSIGVFSFIPYYLFLENSIMKGILKIFSTQKQLKNNLIALLIFSIFSLISILLALLPTYNNTQYQQVLKKVHGCKLHLYKTFQYSCLYGTSIIAAGLGILIAMNYMEKPYNLSKIFGYTRCSGKFVGKVLITIIVGVIPLLVFMNPLWDRIETTSAALASINWVCSNIAFFLATFNILFLGPIIGEKLGLEVYKHPNSYGEFKKFQVINMLTMQGNQVVLSRPRQTQLTEPKFNSYGGSGQ